MNHFPALKPRKRFSDDRGYFTETLNMLDIHPSERPVFIQQNISYNHKWVFRGMHYQLNNPQGKMVTVLSGSATDYVLDLRRNSPEYGQVTKFQLEASYNASVWVPPGCAHGFLSRESDTIFMYNVFGNPRVEGDEYSIHPFEFKEIYEDLEKIPIIIMSEKDRKGLSFKDAPKYV